MYYFWPEDYTWSYQLVRTFGAGDYGGGQFHEVYGAARGTALHDIDSWHREFSGLAGRVEALGRESLVGGHTVSAREALFRAANYYRNAEFFLPHDDPRRKGNYAKIRECFLDAARFLASPPETVEIPYEGGSLPAYFYRAGGDQKAPTLLFIGGLESIAEELFFFGSRAAVERGISCCVMEGPGQGASLRERDLFGRYDFEVPVSAGVDYLLTRPDVDSERIALMGLSMGGYLSPRAASFEHRLRACIAWGAIYDFAEVWDTRPDDHPLMKHFVWLMKAKDVADARERAKKFRLEGVVEKIRCPFLVTHGEGDVQINVSHAHRMYEAATCNKHLKTFSPAETGETHCQLDNLSLAHRYMFDWLEEKMK